MTWTVVVAVAMGGAVGAPLRLLIDRRVTRGMSGHPSREFPWGLLTVNALGSLLIGIAYVVADGPWRALIATGTCGALTTYSSYALHVRSTWRSNRRVAWQAIIVMPATCITVCAVAVVATRSLMG